MADEASVRHWLHNHCPSVWSILNSQARRQLPPGVVKYLSPLSEEQLDVLAEERPDLRRGYLFAPFNRQREAEGAAQAGRENLLIAEQQLKALSDVCGRQAVEHAYRRELSGANSVDRLAEILCEIAVCAAVSRISSTPPQLHPSSGRQGRLTQCDVSFEMAGVRIYGEVKRYPAPVFREPAPSGARAHLRAIRVYQKLQEGRVPVPEQFPEGTVNMLFIYHRSLAPRQTLHETFLGWPEDRLRPPTPDAAPQEGGLFARAEWRGISGACLCMVEDGWLRCSVIWENPHAGVAMPPLVHSALSRGPT